MAAGDVVLVRIDLERVKERITAPGKHLTGHDEKLVESFLGFLGFSKRDDHWYEVREARLVVLEEGEILERRPHTRA